MNEESLSSSVIQNLLLPSFSNIIQDKIHVFAEIDSTNTEAKKYAQNTTADPHGTVILAEKQTAGRGRLGRSFFSPSQSGLYMSVIYRVTALDPMLVTALTSVAVTNAIQEVYGISSSIKWVNDIYVDNKKVCGILTEGIISQKEKKIEFVVIGIGVNVFLNTEGFPDTLVSIAGALSQNISVIHSKEFYITSRNKLCAQILNNLFIILSKDEEGINTCISEYKNRSFLLGKEVSVVKPNETYKALVLDITQKAHLVVEKEDGSKEDLFSGEVSIRF